MGIRSRGQGRMGRANDPHASFADIAFERSLDESGEHFSLETLGRPKQSKVRGRAPSILFLLFLLDHDTYKVAI